MWMLKKLGWLLLAAAIVLGGFEQVLFLFSDYPILGGGEFHFVFHQVPEGDGWRQETDYYWAVDVHKCYGLVVAVLAVLPVLGRLPLPWPVLALLAAAMGCWRWWRLVTYAEAEHDRTALAGMTAYFPVVAFLAAWLAHHAASSLARGVSRLHRRQPGIVVGCLVGPGAVTGILFAVQILKYFHRRYLPGPIESGVAAGLVNLAVGFACAWRARPMDRAAALGFFAAAILYTRWFMGLSSLWLAPLLVVALYTGILLVGGMLGRLAHLRWPRSPQSPPPATLVEIEVPPAPPP